VRWYWYKHPITGKPHRLSKSKSVAIDAAIELNAQLIGRDDVVERVLGIQGYTINKLCDLFMSEVVPERELAENTVKSYLTRTNGIRRRLGELSLETITLKDVAAYLDTMPAALRRATRGLMVDMWKEAIARGLTNDNLPAKTIQKKVVRQRSRLSLEQFNAIRGAATELGYAWLVNAMDLALQTTQRPSDLLKIQPRRDIKDGYLYLIQQKTEKHGESAHLKIKIEPPLARVIKNCNDGIASPFLLHRRPVRVHLAKRLEHWTMITIDILETYFRRAREHTGLFDKLSRNQKPTFYEIRALAIHLYELQGIDAQKLAGHAVGTTTDIYRKGHIEWTETSAGLVLPAEKP
jgi:hypothetical protein